MDARRDHSVVTQTHKLKYFLVSLIMKDFRYKVQNRPEIYWQKNKDQAIYRIIAICI